MGAKVGGGMGGAGVTASEAKGVGEAALNRLSSQVSVDGLEFAR